MFAVQQISHHLAKLLSGTPSEKMLESRSEDVQVLFVKLVKSTVVTVETVETAETVLTEDLKKYRLLCQDNCQLIVLAINCNHSVSKNNCN